MNRLYIDDPTLYNRIADQNLIGRWNHPKECAKAIKYLCVDATFTTGTNLIVDGGEMVKNRWVPGSNDFHPYQSSMTEEQLKAWRNLE